MVQVVHKKCQLCCHKGVLKRTYVSQELRTLSSDWSISLEAWQAAVNSHFMNNLTCLETCDCILEKCTRTAGVVDLTGEPDAAWLADQRGALRLAFGQCHRSCSVAHSATISSRVWPSRSHTSADSGFPSAERSICAYHPCWRQSLVYPFQPAGLQRMRSESI